MTNDLKPLVEAARVSAAAENWDAARAQLRGALDQSPDDAVLHALMGLYTARAHRLPAAERERLAQHHLEQAIQLDPREPLGHHNLGLVLLQLGNPGRARHAFEAALAARPGFQPAREALDKMAHPQPEPQPSVPRRRGAGGRNTTVVLLSACVVVLAAVVAFFNLRGDSELRRLARQLGTTLPILGSSPVGTELHLQVGDAWETLSADERAAQRRALAQGGARLGYRSVFVHVHGASDDPGGTAVGGSEDSAAVIVVGERPHGPDRVR